MPKISRPLSLSYTQPPSMKTTHPLKLSALIAALVAGLAHGQTVPPSDAAPEKPDDKTIVLSPFEISESGDTGYQARETLAGGRTRTSLDDIANSIDVITGQMIEDMAALDFQDVASFGNNIQSGSLMGDGNTDGALTALWDQNTAYFRGFRTYRGTRNFMFTLMSFNSFSSDRLDLSKGPNAVLFGIGEPGGAINYNTKRASLSRNRTELSLRTDSEGSIRGQVDTDITLIKNKLGFRAVLLSERTDYAWRPAYSDTDGAYFAASYRPFEKTLVRANFEYRNVNRALGRRVYPRDSITNYLNAGAPRVIAPVTSANGTITGGTTVALASVGLARNSANRMVQLDSGAIVNTLNNATTTSLSIGTEDTVQVREGVYPEATVIEGRNGISDSQDKMGEVTVEQELAKNLNLELGFADWQMQRLQGQGTLSNVHNLQIDPNAYMPSSTTVANPNVGKYYTELSPFLLERRESTKTYRATLSYALDLRKQSRWLGSHRASIMWENYEFRELWDARRLYLSGTPTGSLPNADPNNTANYLWIRQYYDFAAGNSYMRDITSYYYRNNIDLGGGYTASWRHGANTNMRNFLTDTTTRLAVWQGSWFDDRLNLTWGYRGVEQKNYRAGAGQGYVVQDTTTRQFVWRDPATGETYTSIFDAPVRNLVSIDEGPARNEGAVVKVLPWLSLSANHATNFNPTTNAPSNINGKTIPAPRGETKDFSVRFKLLKGKLDLSALYYETSAQGMNAAGTNRSSPFANIDTMYDILVANGVIAVNPFDATAAADQVVYNQSAKGYEFTVYAQPFDGLSVRLNAAKNENVATDVGLEVIEYYQKVARPMLSNAAYANLSNGSNTIATLLASADRNLQTMKNYDGRATPPVLDWSGSLNVSYALNRDSWWRGTTIGGAVRWQGPAVMGYWNNADGTLDLGRRFMSADDFTFDLFARYRRKLTNKITWSVQFNVRNLADDPGFVGAVATNAGTAAGSPVVITRYRLKEPRTAILSNTFSF